MIKEHPNVSDAAPDKKTVKVAQVLYLAAKSANARSRLLGYLKTKYETILLPDSTYPNRFLGDDQT